MTIEEIYKQLNFHYQLDDDDKQDLAIKLWTKREQYVLSAGTLATWISSAAKNHLISKARSKKERENNMQIPLSHFEQENEEGHTISAIEAYLVCNDSTPMEQLIASENKKELLERIYGLDTIYSDALLAYLSGDYDSTCSTQRARLSRAKEALVQGKKKERYKLIDLQTQQQFEVETLTEAAKIVDMTVEGIRWALNNSGLIRKKTWQISVF